jgi:hypothetical protein
MASNPTHEIRPQKIIVCHHGHGNDVIATDNLFEFFAACGVDHDFRYLGVPYTSEELQAHQQDRCSISLLGFNSQIDHSWVEDEPLPLAAARRDIPVVQWILDHPSSRWSEFNYSRPETSRFALHSHYSKSYFERFCCAGAKTAAVGSLGPNRRSRYESDGCDAFARRPIACQIALGLARLGVSPDALEAQIVRLGLPLKRAVQDAISRARFDLDGPLEIHLIAALKEARTSLYPAAFNRCFRLVNNSVQYFRRARIMRVASRFAVNIQSDAAARNLIKAGPARFLQDVSTSDTLDSMPLCRSVLSVSPVNDSIHDRTCNALNAGCLPILEDNRAHRALFTHGENALLFRYHDESLAECLAMACGSPAQIFLMAERAQTMRGRAELRFGLFRKIVELAQGTVSSPSPLHCE